MPAKNGARARDFLRLGAADAWSPPALTAMTNASTAAAAVVASSQPMSRSKHRLRRIGMSGRCS